MYVSGYPTCLYYYIILTANFSYCYSIGMDFPCKKLFCSPTCWRYSWGACGLAWGCCFFGNSGCFSLSGTVLPSIIAFSSNLCIMNLKTIFPIYIMFTHASTCTLTIVFKTNFNRVIIVNDQRTKNCLVIKYRSKCSLEKTITVI